MREHVWGDCGGFEKVCWGVGEVKGRYGEKHGSVKEGKGRCGGCKKVWGEVWKMLWGECGKACRGGGGEERGMGVGWGKVRGDVGKVWESVWGERGEMCWGVGGAEGRCGRR